ncbi:hypothetical protein ACP2AV_01845 [Aliiroseovarius sp. PTFE2010]|uniref:hypothetical protein n=1 Tax=Aliiroseovarius sp. PTFE2010 TaxID=3417190 RepID=UPI003CFB0931
MPNPTSDFAAAVTGAVSQRIRDVMGDAAILLAVSLLALTAWVAFIAGLVVLLAPLWGLAAAIFAVVILVLLIALILLFVLKRRVRLQKERAALRQLNTRQQARVALLAELPGLLRHRSGALLVSSGLAIGVMIVAALQAEDEN